MRYLLVAFDLDGTLLDDDKNIPDDNIAALKALHESGALLVPATGRIIPGLQPILEKLPEIRWSICINGAQVTDLKEKHDIYRADIPLDTALEFCKYADGVDALYDCYQDNWGYMNQKMYERLLQFYSDQPGMLRLLSSMRTPVDNLADYLREKGRPLQKLQLHFKNMEERKRQMALIPTLFPELTVSSSLKNNIEINHKNASKGQALAALCQYLKLDITNTVAFGDGSNDLDMLKTAGLGVAMSNAMDSVKEAADFITINNNDGGVAYALRKMIL